MAFPTVAARTETPIGTAATTLTINFTQTTGDLVVIFLATAASTALSSISDSFTDLTAVTNTFHILYKVLVGGEGGSMTVNVSSTKAAAIAYNITLGTYAAGIAPAISTVATATSVNPNATACSPTGSAKDYLWITAFGQAGEEADDDTWVTATPATYGNLTQSTSGTGGAATTNCQVASADRTNNATSEDAGSFTTAQSLVWRAYTLAVYPVQRITHSIDARLLVPPTITHSINSLISKTNNKTCSIDSYLYLKKRTNSLEGGSNGTIVTSANSGGASGNMFQLVIISS